MAMAADDYPSDALADAAERIEVPDGYRVEVIEGNIVVSPTPMGPHALSASRLRTALKACLPPDAEDVEMVTLDLPESGQRYIPDVLVMPSGVLLREEWLFPADEALLVAEITSPSNAETDRVRKLRGYARSTVPMYLLIDRGERTVTLFAEPEGGAYRRHVQVPFGEKIEMPEPFTGSLETGSLV